MRLSHLFTKTSKTSASDADSINADLLTRAGYISKTFAGSYSFLPLGLRVLQNITQIVREEMNAVEGQEILMSALSLKDNWEKTGRWEAIDVLFKVPAAGNSEYAMNPTHEEVVTPLALPFLTSYKDLPASIYQFQTKFRNEPRAKSGIMRGREFIMKDMYSFHIDQSDLDAYYDRVLAAYTRVFDRLGLGKDTYVTYASGGTFSKYSHEFQTVLPSGEDVIYISEEAEKDGIRAAVNKEIYEEGMVCPATGRATTYREVRASEVGNIFKLGTKFSGAFEMEITNEEGKRVIPVMGCYGIGISRLMGVIAEYTADSKGLAWLKGVAPFSVHLMSFGKEAATKEAAEKLYAELGAHHVLFDDRDKSLGEKFADSDLLGMPIRILVSDKSLAGGGIEIKFRAEDEARIVPLEHALGVIKEMMSA